MEYRAVGNRCAVSIESLGLPISREETLTLLNLKGFFVIGVDIVSLARQCIGTSKYRRGARFFEAPEIVDCSSFIKWLYGQRGIWLPRRSIQQRELGEIVDLSDLISGDVVFASGSIDYYYDDPSDGVGHVGIATQYRTIIHAVNSRIGVTETSFERFIGNARFRGIRRYIPKEKEILTFKTPVEREVETADDVRWILLQSI